MLILKAGRHLLALLNDVLDIARIEGGHLSMSVEPVQFGTLIADVLDLVRPLAEAAGCTWPPHKRCRPSCASPPTGSGYARF